MFPGQFECTHRRTFSRTNGRRRRAILALPLSVTFSACSSIRRSVFAMAMNDLADKLGEIIDGLIDRIAVAEIIEAAAGEDTLR